MAYAWMCLVLLPLIRAQSDVRVAPRSIKPDNKEMLTDNSVDTCAAFTTVGTVETKLRYASTCTNTTLHVSIKGLDLGCRKNLYVSPISAEQYDDWRGRLTRCKLDKDLVDPEQNEWCFYTCNCPAAGCQEIQLLKKPFQGEASSWSLCTLFTQCNPPVTNLALQTSVPWHCTSSTALNSVTQCNHGTDGHTNPGYNVAWVSNGESEGAWHRVNFLETVLITHAILWQPCIAEEQSKTVTFSFSDSTSVQGSHVCDGTDDWLDCSNIQRWDRYEIWPPRQTTYVILTATGNCAGQSTGTNNGFIEIEYYALPLPIP